MLKYYSQICQIGLFFILLKTLKRYIYGVGQGGISSLKTRKKDQKDRVPAAKMNKFLNFLVLVPSCGQAINMASLKRTKNFELKIKIASHASF